MRVESTELTEEDLPPEIELRRQRVELDHFRDLFSTGRRASCSETASPASRPSSDAVGAISEVPPRGLPASVSPTGDAPRACYTRPRMIKFGRPVSSDVDARLPHLVAALASDPRIDAVWLFGSRARQEADALSDVDLAVLARPDLDRDLLWHAELDWTGLAGQVLGTAEVAVQALSRLPLALREPILRDAKLLWSRAPELAADFVACTLKAYLDLAPYLDRYDRDLFQQAAAGTLR
jgi:predicted nucleotidyltransferase